MKFKCLIFNTLFLVSHLITAQLIDIPFEKDSFFIESNPSGQLYFNYKVNKKQTLYHISKSFDVDIDSIIDLNREIQLLGLQENFILKIPIYKNRILFNTIKNVKSCIQIYYKIKPGENLYHISKRKFEIPLENLKILNNLNNLSIAGGNVLIIGFYPLNHKIQIPEIIEPENPIFSSDKVQMESEILNKNSRGVAICQYDHLGSGRLFALHNSALMDSEIEIENPILNRKVYAKVIGRIPPIYERDIQIVVSAETARLLGAVDKRFFVSIKYR